MPAQRKANLLAHLNLNANDDAFKPLNGHEVNEYFDLERMQEAINAPRIDVPYSNRTDELMAWLDSSTEKDFA